MNAKTKPIVYPSDIRVAEDAFDRIPSEPPPSSIVEWTENNLVMPADSPMPGMVKLSRSPWAREWMENMSPYSPCQIQAILKASQIAATFAGTSIIGYWLGANPTAIIYVSGTRELLEKWSTNRLEPLLDSCGIRELIADNAAKTFSKSSRRSGDKMFEKIVFGGRLGMGSLEAPSTLRMESYRVGIIDETDSAKKLTSTGEGVAVDLILDSRFKQWGARKNVMLMSTPTTLEKSIINKYYEQYDQRHFMVPCPLCGKRQYLHPYPDEGNHGLRADTTAGRNIKMYYLCEFCHDAFFENSKSKITNQGIWEPFAVSSEPETHRSYYMNSLYAPPGTLSWKEYYTKYKRAIEDPEKMRTWTNLMAGLPYREQGERQKKENVIMLRSGYRSGDVQQGVLFLVIAADVQRGSREFQTMNNSDIKNHVKNHPIDLREVPRVELEVLGIGTGYRTWSIDYKIFPGRIEDAASGAWEDLYHWLLPEKGRLEYFRKDGFSFTPEIVLIDSGDGVFTNTVYSFCARFNSAVYPLKGKGASTKFKNKIAGKEGALEDPLDDFNFKRYSISNAGPGINLVTMATNYYKRQLYNALSVERTNEPVQRPRFCEFPRDYPDVYFDQLRAYALLRNGSLDHGKRPAEAADCRAYALCAADVHLDGLVKTFQEEAKRKGKSKAAITKITKVAILEQYKAATGNVDYYKNDKYS